MFPGGRQAAAPLARQGREAARTRRCRRRNWPLWRPFARVTLDLKQHVTRLNRRTDDADGELLTIADAIITSPRPWDPARAAARPGA